jgi:uncharacterized protein
VSVDLKASILGLTVGFLVGLTGMGGGAVMTPMLILLGWVQPAVAVGTDLAWGALTRAMAAFIHYRQGSVDLTIVRRLSLGSIPGALGGIFVLGYVRHRGGEIVLNRLMIRTLGMALIFVASILLARSFGRLSVYLQPRILQRPDLQTKLTMVLGGLIGFLVSISSVGSGSLIVALLLVLYPTISLSRIVGSDLLHALLLLSVAGLGHLEMGNINQRLLITLLIGSIPGVWAGSRLSVIFPDKVLRPILAATLISLGYKLL